MREHYEPTREEVFQRLWADLGLATLKVAEAQAEQDAILNAILELPPRR